MMNHRRASFALIAFLVAQLAVTYGSGTEFAGAGQQTIEGLVRDISCPLQNKAATATKFNLKCARQCVEQGSPSFPRTVIFMSLSRTQCRTKANENDYYRLLASM
jgi:hypothetical protein